MLFGFPGFAVILRRAYIDLFGRFLSSQTFELPNHPETLPIFFLGTVKTPWILLRFDNRPSSVLSGDIFLRLYFQKYLETLAVFFWSGRSAPKRSRFPVRRSSLEPRLFENAS